MMTLSALEGHSLIASLFKGDISYLWPIAQSLYICRAFCWVVQAVKERDRQTDRL